MAQKYRTDGAWGAGIGRKLTPAEVDENFWDGLQRIVALEALPAAPAGIDHFSITGRQLYVTLTDATVLGPYTLPVASYTDRGTWAPATPYSVLDTFTINGGLYEVLFAHTSAGSFDPGANDGSGHDYYHLLIQTPGSSLPTGGATAQKLSKASSTDFAVEWSWTFPGSATAGKYLRAVSSTQDNVAWAFIQADEVRFTPVTGSSLTSTNVADALEALSEQTFSLSTLSDVIFATGDPQFGALLTYDGAHWTSTDPLSINELLQWNGSAFIGVTALTNVNVTTPAGGDTMSYDFGTASWINRKGYVNIGATSSNVTIGDSNNYATVRFTPSASLQIVNSGLSNDGEKTTLIIVTSGTTSRNITAGSNVVMTGTLATGTVDAVAYVLTFVTDGASGKMYEVSRAGPMS